MSNKVKILKKELKEIKQENAYLRGKLNAIEMLFEKIEILGNNLIDKMEL